MPVPVETVLTPAEIALLPGQDLRECVCVVFDVLRATSTILTALAHGARQVFPTRTIEEALRHQHDHWPGALLGGERGGVRIEGFQLGNSPLEYTRETVAGRDIITTTTNGTVALRACREAREVLAGAFLNLPALADHLAKWLTEQPGRLLLVCAGTGTRFALEDGLAAGALLARLQNTVLALEPDDASLAMLALQAQSEPRLLPTLQSSENGQKLAALGLAADVEWCARTGALPLVATLRNGVLAAG